MDYEPIVSIIVPVFNVERYIECCIESISKQTLKEIEIILVDDGSTDSSGKICDHYAVLDSRINVIHQENIGSGLSRNIGLAVAKGTYIGFVDSDDCCSIHMYRELYENAIQYNADISYCISRKFSVDSEINMTAMKQNSHLEKFSGEESLKKYLLDRIGTQPEAIADKICGSGVFCGIFRRSIIEENHIRFPSERMYGGSGEDMLFHIDLIPHCNCIVHSNSELYFYRNNPESLTRKYKKNCFEGNLIRYHEIERKISKSYSRSESFNSLSRYFLTFSRVDIIQEVLYMKKNGFRHTYTEIKKICRNTELQTLLDSYEYGKLPKKYHLICLLEKKKASMLLIFLIYAFYKKKGNL